MQIPKSIFIRQRLFFLYCIQKKRGKFYVRRICITRWCDQQCYGGKNAENERVMLLAVGLYFTLRSRFVQLRLLPESIRVVGEKTDSNSVSAFQALMVSTASRVGTGNIVGVANAIAIGGYGAVFWMWTGSAPRTRDCGRRIGFC